MLDTLVVNEIFGPTIQGEGVSVGRNAVFLRLGTCNLTCDWCDTKYTWDWKHFDPGVELHRMSFGDIYDKIEELGPKSLLIITGGEPLLQQKKLVQFVGQFTSTGREVEIETNGTIPPHIGFSKTHVRFNVSPKLQHSGNRRDKRIVHTALTDLVNRHNSTFKFVCQSPQHISEVELDFVEPYKIPAKRVYVMPLGTNTEDLEIHTRDVIDLVLSRGWNLTPRMHVQLWGDRRGV